MDEFIEAVERGEDVPDFEGGEATDFVLKKSYLGKNDLCFCGSGKKVIDCCIPEDEFNRLVLKEKMKRQKAKDKRD